MTLMDMLTLRVGRYKLRPFGLAWWCAAIAAGAVMMVLIGGAWIWTIL